MKYVAILFAISSIFGVISIYYFVQVDAPLKTILLRAAEIVTIAVPPALPTCLSTSIENAM